MRIRLVFLSLVTALIGAIASVAPSGQTPQPTFRSGANYVRVDMYATREGRAVDDLMKADVTVLEDGVPQDVVAFEHVRIRGAGLPDYRPDASSVAESRERAAEARARVFVVFLDTYHTQIEGSQRMRVPLARFLDRAIGPDDLVAVMTPEMEARNITFGRKTQIISSMMQTDWNWGRREWGHLDPKEERYQSCYPDVARSSGISAEMIGRRRERLSLDALEDLSAYLATLREERKAVLAVSEGWIGYRANPALMRQVGGAPPAPPGQLGRRGARSADDAATSSLLSECDADRADLAMLDHRTRLLQLAERANRGNVTFYPIYPRGLAATDAPMGSTRPPSPIEDRQNLGSRQDNLRLLAENTDGMSVMNSNDIESGMRRIVDDLTSYYLLGYYSTNTKLDGRFRSISVRVAQPNVKVRARRGYRGASADSLTKGPAGGASASASSAAIEALPRVSPTGLYLRTVVGPSADTSGSTASVWIAGELDTRLRREPAWASGVNADVLLVSANGDVVARTTVGIPAAEQVFSIRLPETGGVAPGEYAVRIEVRSTLNRASVLSEAARVIVAAQLAGGLGDAVMWRRGPATGPRFLTTADARFRRSDRLRLEHPAGAPGPASARMLDRLGRAMQVPVTTTERVDAADGRRWTVAEAVLAPLAPGDYAIEVTVGDRKAVTAFKVVP